MEKFVRFNILQYHSIIENIKKKLYYFVKLKFIDFR